MADSSGGGAGGTGTSRGILDFIEWIGNKLPDPATLFLLGTILIMLLSGLAAGLGWEVHKILPKRVTQEVQQLDGTTRVEQVIDPETGKPRVEWRETGEVYRAKSLLTREGLYWALSKMVDNFRLFPPLGIVLVGMLGIGIAERTGLIAALLKGFMLFVPAGLLTPAMVFIGVMSSLATDAGYVVLPPLAAALYKAVGRSPLVGIAAVFAGVSAGFNANLFITGLDPLLASLTGPGAQAIDPNYSVNPACNWWFMIASTVVITFTGWAVTALFVERRVNRKSPEDGGPVEPTAEEIAQQRLKPEEIRGLKAGGLTFALVMALLVASIVIPGAPLYTYRLPLLIEEGHASVLPDRAALEEAQQRVKDLAEGEDSLRIEWRIAERWDTARQGEPPAKDVYRPDDRLILVKSAERFDRWVNTIVPLLLLSFIFPALAYGLRMRSLRNDRDVAKLFLDTMMSMAPIIVLAFFAGQFIEHFKYSGLDTMLALWGGQALGKAQLSPQMLMVAFILVTLAFNLFVGSMSAKWSMFAPIFVPMFMMVGISPELTQAAYRIGDSVSNIITPLNAYLIIILVFMQKYVPRSGMGTLISLMMPYTIVFTIVWTILLLVWMALGLPLGIDGGLTYTPPM